MSALGQKETSHSVSIMSALLPKADIAEHDSRFRFVPTDNELTTSLSNITHHGGNLVKIQRPSSPAHLPMI
jgi:hypothetical protein